MKLVRQSTRSKRLTKTFVFLWVSWVVCVMPQVLLDLYLTKFKIDSRNFEHDFTTWDTDDFLTELVTLNQNWNSKSKAVITLHAIFRAMKHAYGFINSLLLILLLRPFRVPLSNFVGKIRCKRNTTTNQLENEKNPLKWLSYNGTIIHFIPTLNRWSFKRLAVVNNLHAN